MRIALTLALLASCTHPTAPAPPKTASFALPFIDDDYPRALATAKKEHKPLFVDVWAPWCHTCLSLRAYVLRDPALARLTNKYVWAAIDSEKDKNAAFVAKYPVEAWPTLLVIDPDTETPTLRWLGAANVEELTMLLDDVSGSAAAWIEGNRAAAEGRAKDAVSAYRKALESQPDPARRARIVDALIGQLAKLDKPACAKLARDEFKSLQKGTSRANVALAGFDCATESADKDALADAITTIVIDPTDPILADDRSALYEVLVEHRTSIGDKKGAKSLAAAWAAFLETEAARAKDPASRTVFDAHRMLAYIELGEPARALPMLEETERDFPADYNAPARIAKVYLVMGKPKEARVAIERALSKAYGPRTLRLLSLKADIAKAAGDVAEERATLDKAIALAASLPPFKGSASFAEKLKIRRAALDPN